MRAMDGASEGWEGDKPPAPSEPLTSHRLFTETVRQLAMLADRSGAILWVQVG